MILLIVYWISFSIVTPVHAGESILRILERKTEGRTVEANIGDTLTFDLTIDTRGENITGYAIFLTFDDHILQLISQGRNTDRSVKPFIEGRSLQGSVFKNTTHGDVIGQVEDTNGIPGFQIDYEELTVPPVGGIRPSRAGQWVIASFSVIVVKRSPEGSSTIRVDEDANNSRETTYFLLELDRPNRFRRPLEGPDIGIIGFRLFPFPTLNLTYGEADTLVLDEFVDDPVTPDAAIRWTIVDPGDMQITLDQERRRITVAPRETSLPGTKGVVVSATNAEGTTIKQIIPVTLTTIPLISLKQIAFDEDSSQVIRLDEIVEDDDPKSTMTWRISGYSFLRVQFNRLTREVSLTAPENWNGTDRILFTVTDPHGRADSLDVPVVVRPVNDPPRFLIARNLSLFSNTPIRLPLRAVVGDPDTPVDRLTITWSGAQRTIVSQTQGELILTAPAGWSGEEHVSLKVTDGEGEDTTMVNVTILPIGLPEMKVDREEILLRPEDRDTLLALDDYVADPDTPDSLIVWRVSGEGFVRVTIDSVMHLATITAPGEGIVSEEVILTATDPNGGSATLALHVIALPAGRRGPIVIGMPAIRLTIGGPAITMDLRPYVIDPEYDDGLLVWDTMAIPPGITARITGQEIVVRASSDAAPGNTTVHLTVTDPEGLTDQGSLRIALLFQQQIPVQVRTLPDIRFHPDSVLRAFDLDSLALDDSPDSLIVWSFAGNERVGVMIDPVAHLVTFISSGSWIGQERIRFTAYDPDGTTASGEMTVTVFNTEQDLVPHITFPEKVGLLAGGATVLRLDEFVTDLDNDATELTWRILTPPSQFQMTLDTATRSAVINAPQSVTGGSWSVLEVQDPDGRATRDSLLIFAVPTDGTPVTGGLSTLVVGSDSSVTVDLGRYYYDADNTDAEMLWSVVSDGPVEVTIDQEIHRATFRRRGGSPAGSGQATLTVVDPDLHQASMTILVTVRRTVQGSSGSPVVGQFPDVTLMSGGMDTTIQLDTYVRDDDTPPSLIHWRVTGGKTIRVTVDSLTRSLVLSPYRAFMGTETLVVTAVDRFGEEGSALLTVVVVQSDTTAPVFTVGLLQNPILRGRLTVYVAVSESLSADPEATVDGITFPLEAVRGERRLFIGRLDLRREGSLSIEVKGRDIAGNEGRGSRMMVVGFVSAKQGGLVVGSDGRVKVVIEGGNEGAVVVYQDDGGTGGQGDRGTGGNLSSLGGRIYTVVGEEVMKGEIQIWDGGEGHRVLGYSPDGQEWQSIPTRVDPATGFLIGRVERFGAFCVLESKGDVVITSVGRKVELFQNRPNPFHAETTIRCTLPMGGFVQMKVYDLRGQLVKRLVYGYQTGGKHRVVWDGNDERGQPVATGVYFYRLSWDGYTETKRMMVVR